MKSTISREKGVASIVLEGAITSIGNREFLEKLSKVPTARESSADKCKFYDAVQIDITNLEFDDVECKIELVKQIIATTKQKLHVWDLVLVVCEDFKKALQANGIQEEREMIFEIKFITCKA